MQNPANYASTYAGWDFATVWSAPSAGYYPQLYGVNYVLRVDPANASRVYGEANPAFTYSIYGFHAGDTAGIVNGLSVSTAATTTSNAGTYAISASGGSAVSVSGQAYRFIDAPGTLTVTPRAITVTADAQSRVYGDANPVLTYQVGGSGLVNGDTLSGALATAATAASNVGIYGITQGTLALAELYDILIYRRQPDRHAARDHGDGRCQEPRLWRCQSGADLSGRRLGPRQWRHTVGRAGDIGDHSQQCRRLRHHARHARGLVELRLHLCWSEPHDYASGLSSADREARIVREIARRCLRHSRPSRRSSPKISRSVCRNHLQIQAMPQASSSHNRRIGDRAKFVDDTDRNRLPAFLDH